MRYLISQAQAKSKNYRIKYISETFKLNVLKKSEEDNFITLDSIPLGYGDAFFILGHDSEVYNYLRDNINYIKESNIVAISCKTNKLKEFTKIGKRIFVPVESEGYLEYYDGAEYGFNFDITDCELDLYNNKEADIISKIEKCMIEL